MEKNNFVKWLYAVAPPVIKPFVPIGVNGPGAPVDTISAGLFPSGGSVGGMVQTAFTMALSLGAILAVLRIVYAGYLYMGSADMWSSKGRAKEVFGDAIIGLLILFAVWIILNQINPGILNIDVFRTFNTK